MYYEEIMKSDMPLITKELIEDAIKNFFFLKEKEKNNILRDDIDLIELSFLLSILSNDMFASTKDILDFNNIDNIKISNYFNIDINDMDFNKNNIDTEEYYDTFFRSYMDLLFDEFNDEYDFIYPEDIISDIINDIFVSDFSNSLKLSEKQKEEIIEDLQELKMKRYNNKNTGITYEKLNSKYLPFETSILIKNALKWYYVLYNKHNYKNDDIKTDTDKVTLCLFLTLLDVPQFNITKHILDFFSKHYIEKESILKYFDLKEEYVKETCEYEEKELEEIYNNIFRNEIDKMLFGIWTIGSEYKYVYPETFFKDVISTDIIYDFFKAVVLSDFAIKELCNNINHLESNIDCIQRRNNKFFNVNNYADTTRNNNRNEDYEEDYSLLKRYGYFLDEKEYLENPAIGREEEIKNIIITLLKPNKSSILVGEAGVGKTAVVEGLAYLIQNNKVPEKLKEMKIISITTSSLLAGCTYRGDFEKRVEDILKFLMEHKEVVLFIDEIHTIMGAGSAKEQKLDFANILKPYLDRGDIKIIGSTTEQEYNEILTDSALRRRFEKTNIKELDRDKIKQIINTEINKLENNFNIKFDFDKYKRDYIIEILLNLTMDKNKVYTDKINNPDLVLSILSDFFASASYNNRNFVNLDDIKFAILRCDRIYESIRKREIIKLNSLIEKKEVKCKVLKLYPERS